MEIDDVVLSCFVSASAASIESQVKHRPCRRVRTTKTNRLNLLTTDYGVIIAYSALALAEDLFFV